ncbi:hypothetical protein ACFP3N_19375, partial [Alloalcanivorax gelatiniphagus]
MREPDEADQAAQEEEQRLVLRALDREIRLLDKIDAALRRLTRGEYAIDAKTRRENREQHYRPVRGLKLASAALRFPGKTQSHQQQGGQQDARQQRAGGRRRPLGRRAGHRFHYPTGDPGRRR